MRRVGPGIKPGLAMAFVLSIALVCFLAARYWFSIATYAALQPIPLPRPLVNFHLHTADGKDFSVADLQGRWTLVAFGFAHCADVCPLELEVLNKVLKQQKKYSQPVQVVFVGLDPDRDSPQALARFAATFNANIKSVTGNNPSLAKFAHFFRADFNRSLNYHGQSLNIPAGFDLPEDIANKTGSLQTGDPVTYEYPSPAADHYQVTHTSRIFLLNPLGEYIGSFSAPQDAEKIIADLQMIIKR